MNGTTCHSPRSTRQWRTPAVIGELELAADEPVGELAGLDGERADVAGDRLAVALGIEIAAEDTSNTPWPGFAGRTEDECEEMGCDRERRRLRSGHREHRAR